MVENIINAIKKLIASGRKSTVIVDLQKWSSIMNEKDLKWILRGIKSLEFTEDLYWKIGFRINNNGTVTYRYDPDGVKPPETDEELLEALLDGYGYL